MRCSYHVDGTYTPAYEQPVTGITDTSCVHSLTAQIVTALKMFGMGPNSTRILVAAVDASEEQVNGSESKLRSTMLPGYALY